MRKKMSFDVRVGASRCIVGDQGVIATRRFQPHDVVFEVLGPIVEQRTKWSFQVGPNEHIDPFDGETPTFGYYLNHSCDPNVYVKVQSSQGKKRLFIYARRSIAAGEDVAVDYATMEYELTVTGLPCRCGAANCRGALLGFKDLPAGDRSRYIAEGMIPEHLLVQEKNSTLRE
ncbi:MAG: SET domain-containing protein-lysine N-methyltransferase [bacterium]|nr:SET domain-containing protein-lysine N-methyltransferase [bacterium]